ncbi:MAG: gluconate 2-dehydrogenase subunit 3 family protein [Acidobacteriota bacterium]|nr:gluconate 2-dehydrogenase subunit 3 family protein [Acidobacteriota bacterium]MDQ2842957.1 gluconate 2-dehydrogenase subunit 3 family protein [Acidobacteriota bacterium]
MSRESEKPDLRPIDLKTGQPLPLMKQPGYYRGFHTLSQQKFWDAATRNLILDRVENVPPLRFFDEQQAKQLEIISDRVLPQDDREEAYRIPIVAQIDRRLFEQKGDGYRFEGMPPDREAFILGLKAIDEMSRETHGRPFTEIELRAQEELLQSLHDGKPIRSNAIWEQMPVHRFWMLLVQDCIDAYYSHPWAWDEIGFGGPAYPRAYMRLERGEPEPWEVKEKRYEWLAPPCSISGKFSSIAGEAEHLGSPGQGGTH